MPLHESLIIIYRPGLNSNNKKNMFSIRSSTNLLTNNIKYCFTISKQTTTIHLNRYQYSTSSSSSATLQNIVDKKVEDNSFRVLFFGTDHVSIHTLKKLHDNLKIDRLIKELEVVCPNNKDELVYQYAKKEGLSMYHPDIETGMKQFQVPVSSKSGKPFDMAVVVSFGYFIPKKVLNTFTFGGINVHPSLLPKYRGAAPIYHTLINDDRETGVSIIKLDPLKFDVGDILDQTKYKIKGNTLYLELLNELASIGANSVIRVLDQFKNLIPWAQGEDGVSRAPKINKDNGRIDWENDTCQDIWTKYRAFSDTISIYTHYYSKKSKAWKRVKLYDMINPLVKGSNIFGIDLNQQQSQLSMMNDIIEDTKHLQLDHTIQKNGQYFITFDRKKSYFGIIWVKCLDGWVGFKSAHEEGKKRLLAKEFFFAKGIISPIGENDQKTNLISTQQFRINKQQQEN
ncbi:methionyl-tRNA formyltransferase [Cavenderia fasciculata]|uniref:methionyl-tRNA formyltransferase n=1 Tax=Cavenderia fasciculata TaxID=261658 RepID=F4PQ63_CACFS|nr:methionyl-tRNA formyltransferase [Cavenderia fasciculata]EGG22526.1 methionyl-tRNA formyltransferase [Cavenderia fasciculata]|eukprot:XP_004360377.1 methionyl-tRNA formyltransferase [Cavenderia fasciculata]